MPGGHLERVLQHHGHGREVQHMVDAVRTDVAKQVDGPIWKPETARPDDGDDGAGGGLPPAN
jgi:hypothetical protein